MKISEVCSHASYPDRSNGDPPADSVRGESTAQAVGRTACRAEGERERRRKRRVKYSPFCTKKLSTTYTMGTRGTQLNALGCQVCQDKTSKCE